MIIYKNISNETNSMVSLISSNFPRSYTAVISLSTSLSNTFSITPVYGLPHTSDFA